VVALRSDGAARTAKYQAALEGGHDVLVLISERGLGRLLSRRTEAMRALPGWLGELAQARNDGIDIERASTTWSTSSFTSYHGQHAALAGGAVGGRVRDRAGDQEERELLSIYLECARRTRDSSTGTPRGGVKRWILY
jgi:hypothetical protein